MNARKTRRLAQLIAFALLALSGEHARARSSLSLLCHNPRCPDCSRVSLEFVGGPGSQARSITRHGKNGSEVFGQLRAYPRGSWPSGDYLAQNSGSSAELHIDGVAPPYHATFIIVDRKQEMTCTFTKMATRKAARVRPTARASAAASRPSFAPFALSWPLWPAASPTSSAPFSWPASPSPTARSDSRPDP